MNRTLNSYQIPQKNSQFANIDIEHQMNNCQKNLEENSKLPTIDTVMHLHDEIHPKPILFEEEVQYSKLIGFQSYGNAIMKKLKLPAQLENTKVKNDQEMNQISSKPAGISVVPLNGDIHSFGTILSRMCS